MEKMPRSAGSIAVETWQGSISKDETWDKDYIITGDVIIEPTATLTIKPGVTIFFPKMDLDNNNVGDTDFIVKGRLNCQGLPNKKVVFTSYQDNKQNSDWGGIDFEPQTMLLSTISNAEISFAQEAVHINAHNVTFNACHIHDIKTYGIKCQNMEATHKLTIRKTTIENCSSYGVEINNGDIVIADSHFHHNSTCGLKVSQGNVKISNLLIEKIAGDGANFESNVIVNANELKAISNSSDGVKIKCYEKSVFTNCQFMNNNKFGIDITNSSPDIYNCKVDNNKYSGIKVYGVLSIPIITHCTLNSNSHTGLFFHENAKGVINYSTIIGNDGFGIKINDTSIPSINNNNIFDNG
jgi:parallel beta-helix repeat protein